jgi:hypothetical protein
MSQDVRQIRIGRFRVGLIGLGEIFAAAGRKKFEDEGALSRFLLDRAKESNWVPPKSEAEYTAALLREYKRHAGLPVEEEQAEGLEIKILGPGCPSCDRLHAEVLAALTEIGTAADVEHVKNVKAFARYGVMGTPALIINRKAVAVGKVPSRTKIVEWIEKAQKRG